MVITVSECLFEGGHWGLNTNRIPQMADEPTVVGTKKIKIKLEGLWFQARHEHAITYPI